MAAKIITKFIIGNEQGINDLLNIATAIAIERFKGKVPDPEFESYVNANFNKEALMIELNSMSNQYLMVYADDEPAGYVKVTSKGTRPELFAKKTLARIADFGVLTKYTDHLIGTTLFEKSLSISNTRQVIWISEFENSPYLDLFESYGFKKNVEISIPQELSIPPVYLVKEKA